MVKVVDKGSVPPDDLLFSGGPQFFPTRRPVGHPHMPCATLYYRSGRLGLVFAVPDAAERVDRINRALQAGTWGELMRLMPDEELPWVFAQLEWDDDGTPMVPDDASPMPATCIAGVSEGDYPPWLTSQHESILPSAVIRGFGRRDHTVLNGSVWIFDLADEVAIVALLAERGMRAVRRDDLTFA